MKIKNYKDFKRFEFRLLSSKHDSNFSELSGIFNDPNTNSYFFEYSQIESIIECIKRGINDNHIMITNPKLAELIYEQNSDTVFCFAESALTPKIKEAEQKRLQEWIGQMKNTRFDFVEGAIEALSVGMPYYKLPKNMQLNNDVIIYAIKHERYPNDFLMTTIDFNSIDLTDELVEILINYRFHEGRHENFLFSFPTFVEIASQKGIFKYKPITQSFITRIKQDLSSTKYRLCHSSKKMVEGLADFINENMPIWNRIYEAKRRNKEAQKYKERLLAGVEKCFFPFHVNMEIAESLLNKTGNYADLCGKISIIDILDKLNRNIIYDSTVGFFSKNDDDLYYEFMNKNKDQILNIYDIELSDNVEFFISKYGMSILDSKHNILFTPEIINMLGIANIELIVKYIIIPLYSFPLNTVLEKNSIHELIHIFKRLGGSLEKFDIDLFAAVVNRFDTNFELMNEYLNNTSSSNQEEKKMSLFMSVQLPHYKEAKTIEGINIIIDNLIEAFDKKVEDGSIEDKIKACKDIIFILKYGMISVGTDYDREEIRNTISYFLKNILNSEKVNELEKSLGAEVVSPFKYIVEDWESIISLNSLEQLLEIKRQTLISFKSDKKKNSIDSLSLISSIKSLYGSELQAALTNLNDINSKTIDKKSGIEVFELNGENFAILNHTLNAYGKGGSIIDFSDKVIGKSYLCTSLVTNYNMGHADRGDSNPNTITLGFMHIHPQQFAMSAPRDIWSQSSYNNRDIKSKGGMDCMTAIETSKQTIHTHNEFVIYRDSVNNERIEPNCILCFSEEITDAHRHAAISLGIPIVKINAIKYKILHQERINLLKSIVSTNPSPETIKEYLYTLTSYTSGYAWQTNNSIKGDDFLTVREIGDLVDSIIEVIKRCDAQTSLSCITIVKKFIDDCTLMPKSPYEFMKTKRGEIMRIEESSISEIKKYNNSLIENNLENGKSK